MHNEDQNGKPHVEAVCPGKKDKLDLVQVQADIEKKNGPEFWRSLEELAGSAEFREMMHREFPKGASEWVDAVSRRGFFKLMGSSLALAGMTACTKQPFEQIVPYVKQPEELVLGRQLFYATAFTLGGYATPLLVTSREYRPIKIEGNDRHPASQGGTDVYAQASILDLYDPDRSQNLFNMGNVSDWDTFVRGLHDPLSAQQAKKGAGLRILSQSFSSRTLADQKQQLHQVNTAGDANTFVFTVAQDLLAARVPSVVIPGDHKPPVVHALCRAINQQLGNVGKTVVYSDPVPAFTGNHNDSLKELIADLNAGKVEMLVILGGNPVYDAPADFGFYDALKNSNTPLRIHVGLHNDETAELCHWHVPEAHYLEAWGDSRAYDGTVSIVQPLIAPLYGGKSALEFVALLAGEGEPTGHEMVQNYWKTKNTGTDFDMTWRKWLEQGWGDDTASKPKQVSAKSTNFATLIPPTGQNVIQINFRPEPPVYDGRFANNGWLQELPKPMTKVTWHNPLLMSPAMAERMHIQKMDMVRVETQNSKYLDLPAWVQAGHPDNSVPVYLGYGRQKAGRVGNSQGFNTYTLRTSDAPWFTTAVKQITSRGQHYTLASTQGYQTMDTGDAQRPLVRVKDLEDYKKEPEYDEEKPQPNETLYNETYREELALKEPYACGMTIDLNACVGCNNCIIACQSENNIPIVGKDQVNKGRHMHWLRVDSYYQGDRDNPKAYFQPVPCMQRENAPCELVCPVGATTHSTEGLNDMIYNRCVGTRYCSNNCPYKVRRFNFFLFQDWDTPQFKMQRNPDVTVRSRGVMEKCTYCVQRITHARIKAEESTQQEDKNTIIGQLQTACQQSCPANAIVFGNINDPNSLVSKWKAKSRNYGLLDDLNTRPRTTYIAAVTNPNPELGKSS